VGSSFTAKIGLGWKGLAGKNTLAYYVHSQIADVKSFKSLGLGINVLKLMMSGIYHRVFVHEDLERMKSLLSRMGSRPYT
jgi:hypothetical protein